MYIFMVCVFLSAQEPKLTSSLYPCTVCTRGKLSIFNYHTQAPGSCERQAENMVGGGVGGGWLGLQNVPERLTQH